MADITLPGYLATPDGDGPWPGVVVLHEAFGLTGDIRRQSDRLAAEGYLAFAPDLYSRGPKLGCVLRAFRDLTSRSGRTFEDIEAARQAVAAQEECTGQVGVIGFCMGGGFALVAAARYDFGAASVNYGLVPKNAEEVLAGACPIVASYGKKDVSMRGAARRLDRALTVLDVPHDVKEYPGAGHSFLGDYRTGPALTALRRVTGLTGEPAAVADAWHRIFAFFGEHLRSTM
jgi:carboxymethylenebutenolidase